MAKKDYDIAKKTVQDEILAKIKGVSVGREILISSATNNSSYSGTILEIAGAGELHWAVTKVQATTNTNVEIKIEIDGVALLWDSFTNSSSSHSSVVSGFCTQPYYNGSLQLTHKRMSLSSYDDYRIFPFSDEKREVTNSDFGTSNSSSQVSGNMVVPITNPLRFEESIKIFVSSTYTSTDSSWASVGYTLDDE